MGADHKAAFFVGVYNYIRCGYSHLDSVRGSLSAGSFVSICDWQRSNLMCLLYCLGKENRHTSCKNRSAHLLQHTQCPTHSLPWMLGTRAPRGAIKLGTEQGRGQRSWGGWWHNMCWTVGLWMESGWSSWENKGKWGGWAVRCPTEGGTDEVREKWREKTAMLVGGREHSIVDVSFL